MLGRHPSPIAVSALLLMLSACSDKRGNEERTEVDTVTNPPCDDDLSGSCGAACDQDDDCATGQDCSNGTCRITCADGGPCEGGLVGSVNAPAQPEFDEPVLIDNEPEATPATADDAGLDHACSATRASAELTQVNLLLMFDKSGSMDDDNKWPDATAALIAFLRDPETAGLGVALRFFGSTEPVPGCDRDSCDQAACSQPLVDLGVLTAEDASSDAQEATLVTTIENAAPEGGFGTPIHPALGGAIQWAAARNQQNPGERTAVILVTDGEPNGCIQDIDEISMLAADGLANGGVLTYAIGLEGSNEAQMDSIAQAGGTNAGIFVGAGANAQRDLVAALNSIRGRSFSCDFEIPPPPDGQALDPNKVNVRLTTPASETTFPSVTEVSECGDEIAWYYDDPNAPTVIHLCPAACDLIRSEPVAELEVLIGCVTQVLPGVAR